MAKRTRAEAATFDPAILRAAIRASFVKLDPRVLAKNPVMFVVAVGSLLTSVLVVRDLVAPPDTAAPVWFSIAITLWLWFTVLFANFAEAVAEGRGKAQAETLRKMRKETVARKLVDGKVDGKDTPVPASDLRKGDLVVCEAGDLI